MRSRSHEALGWSLFTAGGVVAALFMPAIIAVTGIGGAIGWDAVRNALSHGGGGISDLLQHAAVRTLIGLIVLLTAIHAAHRIRHTLIDLQVPMPHRPLALVSYTAAATIAALTGVFLWLL